MFVPSTSDAGPAAILPRPPLPEPLVADARELLPNAVFATNPCRIRFYNQASACLSLTLPSVHQPYQDSAQLLRKPQCSICPLVLGASASSQATFTDNIQMDAIYI